MVSQCHRERKKTQRGSPWRQPTPYPGVLPALLRQRRQLNCEGIRERDNAPVWHPQCSHPVWYVPHPAPSPWCHARRQCHTCTSHSVPKHVYAIAIDSAPLSWWCTSTMDSPWAAKAVIVLRVFRLVNRPLAFFRRMIIEFDLMACEKEVWNGKVILLFSRWGNLRHCCVTQDFLLSKSQYSSTSPETCSAFYLSIHLESFPGSTVFAADWQRAYWRKS